MYPEIPPCREFSREAVPEAWTGTRLFSARRRLPELSPSTILREQQLQKYQQDQPGDWDRCLRICIDLRMNLECRTGFGECLYCDDQVLRPAGRSRRRPSGCRTGRTHNCHVPCGVTTWTRRFLTARRCSCECPRSLSPPPGCRRDRSGRSCRRPRCTDSGRWRCRPSVKPFRNGPHSVADGVVVVAQVLTRDVGVGSRVRATRVSWPVRS